MLFASICAIAKDEDKDIEEWASYHLSTGFEHILLYDNNSKIPLKNTLKCFIDAGNVTVIDLPLERNQQLSAYMNALVYWGSNTKWMAFIDVDEFVNPLQTNDIRIFLEPYSDYAAIGMNWAMFGSNGHIRRPEGGILKNYTSCLGINPHIKTILQPEFTKSPRSAHHFAYRDNKYCVNEDVIPVSDFHSYPLAARIQLNHYYYKSREDFQDKIKRGLATQMRSGRQRSLHDFYIHLKQKTYEDTSILRSIFNSRMRDGVPVDARIRDADMESSADPGRVLAEKDHAVRTICEQMKKYDSDRLMLLECYRRLANYYERHGQENVAHSIKDWLGD